MARKRTLKTICVPGKIHKGLPRIDLNAVSKDYEHVETITVTTDHKGKKIRQSDGGSIRPIQRFGPSKLNERLPARLRLIA